MKRILAAGCAGILLFSAVGCVKLSADPQPSPTTPEALVTDAPLLITEPPASSLVPHNDVAFSDMRYERPDTAAIDSAIDALFKRIENGDSPELLLIDYGKIKELYDAADSQASLAYLLYAFDVTDTHYEEEYSLLQSALSALDLDMTDVTIALCESSEQARTLLSGAYGETYLDAVYAGESLNSDAVQSLMDADHALMTEYDRLLATFTLQDGGREWTMDEILSDESLSTREFYRLYDAYCAALNKGAGDIFIRMLSVRSDIAEKLGYGSYAAYEYDCYGRDYTVTDAKTLHAAVKKYIVPVYVSANRYDEPDATVTLANQGDLLARLSTGWQDAFGLLFQAAPQKSSDLLDVYELGLASYGLDDSLNALSAAVQDFSPATSEALQYMLRNGLYDFSVSSKKMAGSFTTYLANYDAPFIFSQWNNDAASIDTVIHELGHFTNYYRNPSVGWSEGDSLDLAEVDSQALQLLMTPYYPQLYGEELADAAEYSLLLDCMYALITGCMEDEFQQAVYAKPDMPLADINALYLRLSKEYGLYDLYGYTGTEWSLISHTFQSPMYYISYAASMVPALELWRLSLTDPAQARAAYFNICDREPYAGFQETLLATGLPDVFDEATCEAIAALLATHT